MNLKVQPILRAMLVLVLLVPPSLVFINAYQKEGGTLNLLCFGEKFYPTSIDAAKNVKVPVTSEFGYDGSFYAQIAQYPLLDEKLKTALDVPEYRARRIGLPWFAWIVSKLTFGGLTPFHAYALSNFFFYLLLVVVLYRYLDFATLRGAITAGMVCLTSGVVISMERSLPDLPAMAVGLLAIVGVGQGSWRSVLMGYVLLAKEHMIINVANVFTPEDLRVSNWRRTFIHGAIILVPVAAWYFYVRFYFGAGSQALSNFTYPLYGIIQQAFIRLQDFTLNNNRNSYLDFIALACIGYQIVYMLVNADYKNIIWRFTFPTALLTLFLSHLVWCDHNAYFRVVLPLTVGFNLLAYHKSQTTGSFIVHMLLGNFGMFRVLAYLNY